MRKFHVRLHGRNFLIPIACEGESKYGFFTNRFVEADDEATAEKLAVDQLRAKESLRGIVRNAPTDPPRIYLDEIVELQAFDHLTTLDQGIVWYPETEQNLAEDNEPSA